MSNADCRATVGLAPSMLTLRECSAVLPIRCRSDQRGLCEISGFGVAGI